MQDFWAAYVEEMWVVVTPEWLNGSGTASAGLDLSALGEGLTALTGEPNPFLAPTPGPCQTRPPRRERAPPQLAGASFRSFASNGSAAVSRNSSWLSSPICTSAMSVKPASQKGRALSASSSRSGPQAIASPTSAKRTNCDAASKAFVVGRSALTLQPPPKQRNSACARSTDDFLSAPQQIGICATLRDLGSDAARRTSSQPLTSEDSGWTATRWSASGAKRGPSLADHVLVEVLTRAQPQGEAVVRQQPRVAAFCATTAGW